MKRILILLLPAVLLTASCSDKTNCFPAPTPAGKWKWVESSGGIANITVTPQTTGEFILLQINTDGNYLRQNGSGNIAGTYTITREQSIITHTETNIIRFGNGTAQSWEMRGSDLYLYDEVYDGMLHHYVKY